MDIERALLKAGVTVAAMFAIYQGSQGMQEFSRQRSEEAKAQQVVNHEKEQAGGYIESLRIRESERRRSQTLSAAGTSH